MTLEVLGDGIELYLANCCDIIPLLAGRYDVVISDPPYGVRARAGMGGGSKGDGGMWAGSTIAGDDDVSIRDEALHLADAPFAVIAAVRLPHPAGTKATVVWDKGEHTGAGDLRLPWKPNFDLVHIGGDGWSWHRRGSGIVRFNAVAGCVADRNDGKRFHPFEKPCSLMSHFIQRSPGKRILDPFMGSGTTGVAAVRCGAGFTGIEIDRKFFDIACKRIADELTRPDMFAEGVLLSRPNQTSEAK